jgi:hypothetical protein
MTPRRWVAVGVIVLASVALLWRWTSRGPGSSAALPIPGSRIPYAVEVLNGTDVDDLARDVTRRLRRAGFDVVSYGSAPAPAGDSTLVFVRRGDSTAGLAVREALGLGRVVLEADPRRLLDVTVVLGRDAAPADERRP